MKESEQEVLIVPKMSKSAAYYTVILLVCNVFGSILLVLCCILSSLLMPICPGCNESFTHRGYTNHIQQTQARACRTIFQDQSSYLPGTYSEPPGAPSPVASLDNNDPDPPRFEGDFFGDDYTAQDFGFRDPDDSDSEDEGAADPSGWEPAPDPQPPSDGDAMEETTQGSADHTDSPGQRQTSESQIHSNHCSITVKKFGGRAGEVVAHLDNAGYSSYSGGDETNLWAPFSSRTDWEVARWAKLRGPGSTSFSELLNIEGVR